MVGNKEDEDGVTGFSFGVSRLKRYEVVHAALNTIAIAPRLVWLLYLIGQDGLIKEEKGRDEDKEENRKMFIFPG